MNSNRVSSSKGTVKADVYQIVTDKIIESLEKGLVPWHQPWKSISQLPANLITKKHYNGINLFLLGMAPYQSPYFVTYKQATDLGGHVKKGEKGWMVVYWNFLEKEDGVDGSGKAKTKKIPFLRYFTVFNVEQCEGFEEKIPAIVVEMKEDNKKIEACEEIVNGYKDKPSIHTDKAAVYYPALDKVGMPKIESFESSEEYYSTLFHELTHSTLHSSRLNRKYSEVDGALIGYSKEELVAEMGSAFLCTVAGIENKTIDNSASYIKGWLKRLNDDKKFIVSASAAATKAANYILGDLTEDAE